MLKYYKFTAHTPIPGEEQVFYQCVPTVEVDGIDFVDNETLCDLDEYFANTNANEWYDEDHMEEYPEDEYYNDCYCDIEEVDEVEYNIHTAGGGVF